MTADPHPDDNENFDAYGNPKDGSRVINCCFPDCGCDGARLCMAENGSSGRANRQNVEGMYQRTDKKAIRARMELYADIVREKREEK
jgi:hypothetical protein